jgi:hypothetical protein
MYAPIKESITHVNLTLILEVFYLRTKPPKWTLESTRIKSQCGMEDFKFGIITTSGLMFLE